MARLKNEMWTEGWKGEEIGRRVRRELRNSRQIAGRVELGRLAVIWLQLGPGLPLCSVSQSLRQAVSAGSSTVPIC